MKASRTGAPSAWTPLTTPVSWTPALLRELLDGGQAFRWWPQSDGSWRGGWGSHCVQIRIHPADPTKLEFQPETATHADELRHYLALDRDTEHRIDRLPWRSDTTLRSAIARWPGLRILRQPLSETLLGFLCSSTKQIPQIKEILACLAERFGDATATGWNRLPGWPALAEIPERELRDCRMGYRARYVAGTAQKLASEPDWLEELPHLEYSEAKIKLLALPGVGEKIADCVLLFGAQHLAAFPVDTWILKVMREAYGLHDWSVSQVAHFGRLHFGESAGLAQQFLFAEARHAGRRRGGADGSS